MPDLAICRTIHDDMKAVEGKHPGRFHRGSRTVPALKAAEAKRELSGCGVDLGFPGVVIASELQVLALDAEELRRFFKAAADL